MMMMMMMMMMIGGSGGGGDHGDGEIGGGGTACMVVDFGTGSKDSAGGGDNAITKWFSRSLLLARPNSCRMTPTWWWVAS
jgi:hypothetical protein